MSALAPLLAMAATAISLVLVGLALGMQAWSRRMDLRERELEVMASATAERAAQYAANTARLEQRVRMLESRASTPDVRDAPLSSETATPEPHFT